MKYTSSRFPVFDINLLRTIVRAIEKAVTEDVPAMLSSQDLETNNYIKYIRGDWINKNIRNSIDIERFELHSFSRPGWNGRLIIDRTNLVTVSITTRTNLHQIPLKQRHKPHFLQTLLHEENNSLHSCCHQLSFLDDQPDQFDDDTYESDFHDIFGNALDTSDGFLHYIVVYHAEHNELLDIKLVLMNDNWEIVDETDLNSLRIPDFSHLTRPVHNISPDAAVHNQATRQLSHLKQGIKPDNSIPKKPGLKIDLYRAQKDE